MLGGGVVKICLDDFELVWLQTTKGGPVWVRLAEKCP